ncbi:MAG: SOS response-associated peptidase [Bacteroidia bacterium]|nr:SOS response-associated peptidase [Bacteroidia bacterium]
MLKGGLSDLYPKELSMCGRYTFTQVPDSDQLVLPMESEVLLRPRYNIAPSQWAPIIPDFDAGHIHFFRWGLIPRWAKDMKIGYKMINARSETVHEKASFKTSFKRMRCLVLADGFYEWKKIGKEKQPYRITLSKGEVFYMAGLYAFWDHPDGSLIQSFTVITTGPNKLMEGIHNRMPVIFDKENAGAWLDHKLDESDLKALMKPYQADKMKAYPVSNSVGKVANDHPGLIEEVGPQRGLFD